MHASPQPSSRSHIAIYALLCHLALLAHQLTYYHFTEDAAFGLFDWARTLAQSPEAAFLASGSLLAGALGALAHLAGIDVETALKILNMLAAHGLLSGLFLVTRTDASARPFWTRILAPGLLAASAMLALLSTNGLESALFTLLCFVAFVRFASKELRFTPEVALWFVLASLTRPEGAVYAAAALLWHLAGGHLRSLRDWLGPVLFGLAAGAAFATGLLDTRGLEPGTRWTRLLGDRDLGQLSGVIQDPWSFFSIYLVALVLPIAVCLAVMWEWSLVRAALLQVVVTLLWVAWARPDSSPELPLLLPALPFSLLLAQEGYTWLVNRMRDVSAAGRSRVTTVMVLLPLLLAVTYVLHSRDLLAQLSGSASAPPHELDTPADQAVPQERTPADEGGTPAAADTPGEEGTASQEGREPEESATELR